MASQIPAYEYDIFISYRQKDNKGDKWVSKFVEALKTELEATFKEDVSVYFDENPHDRLKETHNVDKSLEGKLKCLIFIPILSQTYCDPASYAWQFEFLAFLKMAEQDHFGRDVKLRSGNVASRILPIRIHDLEPEDVTLFEKETGSVLRALEFVFRTATGVSRPLLSNEDHPNDNLNKTFYRDQLNKVANAIKEIIIGMKKEPDQETKEREKPIEVREDNRKDIQASPVKSYRRKIIAIIAIASVLVLVALIGYQKIFNRGSQGNLRSSGRSISVAVMPFQNMTNDTIWNIWQEGIQDQIINTLSGSEGLTVRRRESVASLIDSESKQNYSSLTQSLAGEISKKMEADVFIIGSIKRAGSVIRLNARMVNAKTGEEYEPFQIEGAAKEETFFDLIDSLSTQLNDYLLLTILKRETVPDNLPFTSTKSPEALRYFNNGFNAYANFDFIKAEEYLKKAVAIDSNFTNAIIRLAHTYMRLGKIDQGKELLRFAYNKRDKMSESDKIWTNFTYARYLQTPNEQLKFAKQLLEIDDQMPYYNWLLGDVYSRILQYDKAIPWYEKTLKIYEKWGTKPISFAFYSSLEYCYHKTGQFKKEENLYKIEEKYYPNNARRINSGRAIIYLSKGDTIKANIYIEKIKSGLKETRGYEISFLSDLAYIYSEADYPDKEEQCRRKLVSLRPSVDPYKYNLAVFLIDKERKIEEGIEILETLLIKDPKNYNYLHWKGVGLFKLNKLSESSKLIGEAWALRLKNGSYNHSVFLQIEEVKKAVAGQKTK